MNTLKNILWPDIYLMNAGIFFFDILKKKIKNTDIPYLHFFCFNNVISYNHKTGKFNDTNKANKIFESDIGKYSKKGFVVSNIKLEKNFICSISPELFFRKNKNTIILKPMKGTAKRGKNIIEDKIISQTLQHDKKNCAENLMIVDLMRNDAGKISCTGSVKVKKLFEIEKYHSLFQMTSTIKSILKKISDFLI